MDEAQFLPDTPQEAMEAITSLRAMINDPQMDQMIAMSLEGAASPEKGIAAFLGTMLIQAQDSLQLPPELMLGDNGVAANLTVDMVMDAVDLGLIDAANTDQQAAAGAEVMQFLEQAMGGGDDEAAEMDEEMAEGEAPQGPQPPQGVEAPFGGMRRG